MGEYQDRSKMIVRLDYSDGSRGGYLIVDKAPLLEEGMDAHYGANVSCKITPACCNGKVLDRIESVRVYHKVSVVFVDSWCFASIPTIEEFGKRLLLYGSNLMHIEPLAIAG